MTFLTFDAHINKFQSDEGENMDAYSRIASCKFNVLLVAVYWYHVSVVSYEYWIALFCMPGKYESFVVIIRLTRWLKGYNDTSSQNRQFSWHNSPYSRWEMRERTFHCVAIRRIDIHELVKKKLVKSSYSRFHYELTQFRDNLLFEILFNLYRRQLFFRQLSSYIRFVHFKWFNLFRWNEKMDQLISFRAVAIKSICLELKWRVEYWIDFRAQKWFNQRESTLFCT